MCHIQNISKVLIILALSTLVLHATPENQLTIPNQETAQKYPQLEDNSYKFYPRPAIQHNTKKTFKAYKELAEQGDIQAQYNLAICYKYAAGTRQDLNEAFKWFHTSAAQDNDLAQNQLGLCYQFGLGTRIDFEKSFKWFERSAKQENPEAQYN
ncbi:MAG: tetratricopeptide repeat protein, partial [bacterium]